jgi:hypothetical protein
VSIREPLIEALSRYKTQPTFDEAFDLFKRKEIVDTLVETATATRELAVHINTNRRVMRQDPLNYRDFLVGVSAIGITAVPHRPDVFDWQVFYAWNTKAYKHDEYGNEWPKCCAERSVGVRAMEKRCLCYVALAIVANHNEGGDGRSGRHGPGGTLDMCETCRDDARSQFRSLFTRGTRVINEHYGTRFRTTPRSMAEIMAHHGETWWPDESDVVGLRR